MHLILLTQFLLSLLRPRRPYCPLFSLTAFPENVLDFASQLSADSDPTAKTALPSGAGDRIMKRLCIPQQCTCEQYVEEGNEVCYPQPPFCHGFLGYVPQVLLST